MRRPNSICRGLIVGTPRAVPPMPDSVPVVDWSVITPQVCGLSIFSVGFSGWKWFRTFVIWMMSVAPNRSLARISFETVASRDQDGNPRRTPAPPPAVSKPRMGRRNREYVAFGSAKMLMPDPPLDGLPLMPAEPLLVTLKCAELPAV